MPKNLASCNFLWSLQATLCRSLTAVSIGISPCTADHQSMHKNIHNKDQVGFNFEQNFALKVCNFPLHPAKDARAHSCNLSMLIFLVAAEGHRVRDQSVKTIHLFNFHTQSFILLQVPHSSIRAPAAVMLSLEVSSEFCGKFHNIYNLYILRRHLFQMLTPIDYSLFSQNNSVALGIGSELWKD